MNGKTVISIFSGCGGSTLGYKLAGFKELLAIDYDKNSIGRISVDLTGVKVLIAEGTYTSLLKNIDRKIFITASRLETLAHRKKRNRGNEVGDPFIEHILCTEHKIIAGHKFLADFIISKDFDVVVVE